ncbi:MAG TPA: hypothetical protein VFT55_17400 [Planctomycetota bacterium]|nr:hypothetical protein [Planctomycetota bacterium]
MAAIVATWGASATSQQPDAEKVAAAAEKWVTSDQVSREQLDLTVTVMLADPKLGIDWLAAHLPEADKAPAQPRSKGVHGLGTHCVLEFLRRQRESGVVFAGQYDDLRRLQPFVGKMLFGLLLETPEWFPNTHRVRLVPALRDVQPQLPDAQTLEATTTMADNATIEPEDLRRSLAAMLWQWGRKQHAQAFIDALQKASSEGDAEDRVQTMLELADLHYQLREYKASANTHRAAQALASTAKVELKPTAWYASACVHALIGDVERGMAALEKCASMHASPHLDESLRLKRSLFETDPEIAVLRNDKRFAGLLELSFGKARPDKAAGR